jgi:hypothetical protein
MLQTASIELKNRNDAAIFTVHTDTKTRDIMAVLEFQLESPNQETISTTYVEIGE